MNLDVVSATDSTMSTGQLAAVMRYVSREPRAQVIVPQTAFVAFVKLELVWTFLMVHCCFLY